MPCSRQPFDEVCRAPVSVQRPCRHTWMTECVNRSSKDVPVCREQIKKTLPCNHMALVNVPYRLMTFSATRYAIMSLLVNTVYLPDVESQ
jgi:hypothetical protein